MNTRSRRALKIRLAVFALAPGDDGPVIATTITSLSFHELAPGPHRTP